MLAEIDDLVMIGIGTQQDGAEGTAPGIMTIYCIYIYICSSPFVVSVALVRSRLSKKNSNSRLRTVKSINLLPPWRHYGPYDLSLT